MKKEYKSFEINAPTVDSSTQEMHVEGHVAIFDIADAVQPMLTKDGRVVMVSDVIHKGAFTKTLNERGNRIAFCKNHDIDDPKGKIKALYEDEVGLFMNVRISDAEPELKTKIKEEIYSEFSFGFVVTKAELVKQQDGSFIRHIYEIKMIEASIVTVARNEFARVTAIKSESDLIALMDEMIESETDETKKLNLIKLKSLIECEPSDLEEEDKSLNLQEPNKNQIDFEKITIIK